MKKVGSPGEPENKRSLKKDPGDPTNIAILSHLELLHAERPALGASLHVGVALPGGHFLDGMPRVHAAAAEQELEHAERQGDDT